MTTKLAEEMNVLVADGMAELTPRAKRKLNEVLRELDAEEASSLAIMGAVGAADWHLVDGTGRVWHLTVTGRVGWNDYPDAELDGAQQQAARMGWELAEC